MGFSKEKILYLLFLFSLAAKSAAQVGFKCTQNPSSTCNSLVGYKTPNATTLFHLQNFFGVKDLNSLLGANNLPFSTPSNYTIKKDAVVKIPFPCKCSNGTGVSDGKQIYTVQKDDGLFYIANNVYMGLVTYPQIQEFNRIPNADRITVGQKLRIPLPCSCDEVEGERVVHYGHLVEEGSTTAEIAKDFGTTDDVLFKLNGIANDSQLIAGTTIDIPLKACNSSVSTTSIDYPLLVPNGTYFFTANSCVKCNCDAANNWTLQCEPSGFRPAAKSTWSTCPSMRCDGATSLLLSNTTTTGCNTSTCAYAGFSSQNILTTLATVSTCPATGPGIESPDDNYASRISLSWSFLRISLPLIMLSVHLN
ncbi:hypothetical protein JCGZ_03077 [Jatropha curcas]|uniref:LysM domain-containing protein n=1 Tax=Jatropha curcas TaxID=180498 RepID=A0A067LD41_JATCU|nr:lysM domain-containing GPI-anchored protein 2 isoform X2 [Jatropha curcas]KDP42014.1 hypothetical protein JCGZ_03077 [Jatropha curcas]